MATVNSTLAVLIVEDSEMDALFIIHHIESSGYSLTTERVETAERLASALASKTWDVVLSDYSLPGFDAAEALAVTRRMANDIPFVIVSGGIGEETAVALMKAGAHDYVSKSNLLRLVPVIEREIAEAEVRKQRKAAEETILRSLEEKKILLKEIHHRVRNNLQIICSLLSLQQAKIQSPESKSVFLESQQRIRSMALVHGKLYDSASLASIGVCDYVQSLSKELLRVYEKPRIEISTNIDEVHFGVDIAVPCGLLLNELLTNSLKHAFPNSASGHVTVTVTCESPGSYVMTVNDDGVGYPTGFDLRKAGTLGSQLICSLVDQLEGSCTTSNLIGAYTTVCFQIPA
jgi:two-component sensor histidine kinase